jgi:hypothetical protein
MVVELKYRGRVITTDDVLNIRDLIAAHPRDSLRALSQKLCEAWQWKQSNGALRDMVCRGMLLMLDRAGQIKLPPVKFVPHNPLSRRTRPSPVPIDTTPIEGHLAKIQPLEFVQVRRTSDEPLFLSFRQPCVDACGGRPERVMSTYKAYKRYAIVQFCSSWRIRKKRSSSSAPITGFSSHSSSSSSSSSSSGPGSSSRGARYFLFSSSLR